MACREENKHGHFIQCVAHPGWECQAITQGRVRQQDEFGVRDPTMAPIAEFQEEDHPGQAEKRVVGRACGQAEVEAHAAEPGDLAVLGMSAESVETVVPANVLSDDMSGDLEIIS